MWKYIAASHHAESLILCPKGGNDYDREVLCVVNLKANLQPISLNIASIGTPERAVAHPRELLKKSAILSNAASVILMHLHPSGNLEPSRQDIVMTDRMQQAFTLMGIGIVDHIIMGGGDKHFSFRERQEIPCLRSHQKAVSYA